MSKSILKIGIAIVGIVLAIPTLGASLGLSAIAIAAIEVGLALVNTILLGPTAPKSLTQTAASRLYATLVTTEPRKWWLGITAGATDIRYQTYTGSKQEFYHQIIAHASHQVQSIDEIWIDNEKAWTKTGGVLGRYVGWLTVTTRELATSSNGIGIDGVWSTSCTLTGCAYTYLKFKLLDTANSKNQSPFQSGVSGRLTFRGKGASVYDPRLDSTVTGGSGSQRAGTQSTWAWSDTASRNPALQLLWYLLGWQINGKIALGMGLPPARIDLASFITAANQCDESVALAAGGTEPRYRGDGVISEGDDRTSVVQNLCQTMNATLRDSGGKISLQVINNDLATPVASFGLNDILGAEQYDQTQPLNGYFNIVRGRRVDPSDQALYQLTDFPQVVLTSPDGIDRIQPIDYPLIQSNGQAQRIAKLLLKRAQYQAKYTATFGSNAWAVSLGNVVQFNHAGLNWTNKLMRVVAQSIGQSGQVKMTLLEESADVYTWAAEDVAGLVGGTPTVVDPTSLPVPARLGNIDDGATANVPRGNWSSASIAYNVNDMVYYNGTMYICILAHTSSATVPSADPTHWKKYSSASLDDLPDGTTYARILGSQLSSGSHKLTVAGSGLKLGDQRNSPAISAMNLRYTFTGSISCGSPSGGISTISVTAGSAYIGGSGGTPQTVDYSAMSCTASADGLYHYLYVDDPTYAGGAATLQQTTSQAAIYSETGRVYIGSIVVPTSGGNAGTSGGGSCVHAEAWVLTDRGFVLAADVEPAMLVRVLSADGESTEWAEVTENTVQPSYGHRLTSASGFVLTLSDATPLTLRDGTSVLPHEYEGQPLPVLSDGDLRWEACTVEPLSRVMPVAHIRCGGRVYAAGDEQGRLILTHNPVKP